MGGFERAKPAGKGWRRGYMFPATLKRGQEANGGRARFEGAAAKLSSPFRLIKTRKYERRLLTDPALKGGVCVRSWITSLFVPTSAVSFAAAKGVSSPILSLERFETACNGGASGQSVVTKSSEFSSKIFSVVVVIVFMPHPLSARIRATRALGANGGRARVRCAKVKLAAHVAKGSGRLVHRFFWISLGYAARYTVVGGFDTY